jgi:4-amino-4-deoxy-L-arabinose transferase-like glycosyltransferase
VGISKTLSGDLALNTHVAKYAAYVFVIALVVRLGALAFTYHGSEKVTFYDDAKIATNIVEGRGYSINLEYKNWLFYTLFLKEKQLVEPLPEGTKPTATKQPVYPIVLSVFFFLFGVHQFLPVFIFQATIAALACSIIVLAMERVSQRSAIIAGLVVALYPPFVYHSVTVPESTQLLMFLITLFILIVTRLRQNSTTAAWLACGVVSGLLIMTDPVSLPFVVLSVCYVVYSSPLDWRVTAKGAIQALVVTLVLFSPWLVRNYLVFGRFPVMKGSVGLIFDFGLHESGNGTWISEDRLVELEYLGRSRTEMEEDAAIRQELIRLFPLHWKEYLLSNIPGNFLHFVWEVRRYEGDRSASYLLGRKIPYIVLLLFSLPVLFKFVLKILSSGSARVSAPVPLICALILIITFTGIYTVFGAYHSRYRFPFELMLILFFAQSLTALFPGLWSRILPIPARAGR